MKNDLIKPPSAVCRRAYSHKKDSLKGQQTDQLVEVKTWTNMDDPLIKNFTMVMFCVLPLFQDFLCWRPSRFGDNWPKSNMKYTWKG